jgi:hypothetical protein
MTTPDRAASPARRDGASASIPDQLPLAMLLALLLVPGALTTLAFVALAPSSRRSASSPGATIG